MAEKQTINKFAQSLPAWLIMLFFTLLGLVLACILAERHPQLYYDIQASASVLDIREQLPKLDILYDGINIRQKSLSLRIISVKIVNDSSRAIRTTDYDPRAPIGVIVSSGRILVADVTESSSEYLRTHASLQREGDNSILFGAVILNPHQYYVIKLLVLHSVGEAPTITPIGSLAGMDRLVVRETYREKGEAPTWVRAFAGSWLIQAQRILGYLIFGGLAILMLISFVIKFDDILDTHKWKRNVHKFKKKTNIRLDERDKQLFSKYIWGGYGELDMMERLLESQETLMLAWEAAKKAKDEWGPLRFPKSMEKKIRFPADHNELMWQFIDLMLSIGLIKKQDGAIEVDSHMKETLTDFLTYLRENGLKDY